MQWLGLSLAEVGLVFLVAATVVGALHLGRERPRRVVVPYLPLWRESRPGDAFGKRFRLRTPLSLLLALSVVLFLALTLGDPAWARQRPAQTLVILLDTSPSMAARDERPTRLAHAKQVARDLIAQLDSDDPWLVLTLASDAPPLAQRGMDEAELERALASAGTSRNAGNLAEGVERGLALLSPRGPARLVLLSDGNLQGVEDARELLAARPNVEARQVVFGNHTRNLAVTQLSARGYPLDRGHHELLVSLRNTGGATENVTLELATGTTPLFREHLALPPGATVTRVHADLTHTGSEVTARVMPSGAADSLPDDDVRVASLPPRRRTRVLAVSRGNRYLAAALELEEYLDVSHVEPGADVDFGDYDVAIFDATLPSVEVPIPALYLAPYEQSAAQPLPALGRKARPFFDSWQRTHPLFVGLALADINITKAAITKPAAADMTLASAGSGLPLVVEGERQGQRFVALTFDLRESDLPLRAAWPLFLLRVVDHLAAPDGDDAARSTSMTSATPTDAEIAPRAVLPARSRPDASTRTAFSQRPLWQLLLLAALVVSSMEWLTFRRRVSS